MVFDVASALVHMKLAKGSGKVPVSLEPDVLEVLVAEDDNTPFSSQQSKLIALLPCELTELKVVKFGADGRGDVLEMSSLDTEHHRRSSANARSQNSLLVCPAPARYPMCPPFSNI